MNQELFADGCGMNPPCALGNGGHFRTSLPAIAAPHIGEDVYFFRIIMGGKKGKLQKLLELFMAQVSSCLKNKWMDFCAGAWLWTDWRPGVREAEPESKGKAGIKETIRSLVDARARTIIRRTSLTTNTSQGGQNSVITDGQFSVVTANPCPPHGG